MFSYLWNLPHEIGLELLSELPLLATYTFWAAAFGIFAADIMLSVDNAMVIAGITSKLPPHQQRAGVFIGATMAIVFRLVLAAFVTVIMGWKGVALLGGLYLVKVAYDLVKADTGADGAHKPASSFWRAVFVIGVVDLSLSYDNVVAVAALAHGTLLLLLVGILMSIPMVVGASVGINKLLERWPGLKWAGAIFLGFIAGKVIAHDALVTGVVGADATTLTYILAPFAVVLVLAGAYLSRLSAAPRIAPAV